MLKEGVDVEDVRALLPAIEAEVADLPTVRKITVEDLDRGVLTGEENVVVVTAPPVEGTGPLQLHRLHPGRGRPAPAV
ncbi:hypothetical protein ACX9I7_16145 [Streptomyces sp. L500]